MSEILRTRTDNEVDTAKINNTTNYMSSQFIIQIITEINVKYCHRRRK